MGPISSFNALLELLIPFYVMGDSNATSWLLNEDKSVHFDERLCAKCSKDTVWTTARRYAALFAFLLSILIVNNLLWYILTYRTAIDPKFTSNTGSARGHLTYFLNEEEQEEVFTPFEHDWTGLEKIETDGYRYADVNWKREKLFPHEGGIVLIPRQLQLSLGLDTRAAAADPDDDSKVSYMIAGFHQLHCLDIVRDSIYFLNGTIEWPSPPFLWSHVLHCIEAVRQGLACGLDPTLIPLDSVWPGIPNGQLHTCRNFDALFRWANVYAHPPPKAEVVLEGPHTTDWLARMELQEQN